MSSIKVRKVNVMPIPKIKKEIVSDDESEETVSCKICNKSFISEIALMNHARVEHIYEYIAGEDLCVPNYSNKKRKYTEKELEAIKLKTDKLISSMQPTNITSLASNDVSYIIIKAEGQQLELKKMKKDTSKEEKEKAEKILKQTARKTKEIKAITGPFECLEPSTHNPEVPCHQIFLSCCEYSLHYREEHTRRRKGIRCQVCEKPIAGEEPLNPHSCQVCGMGFETAKELSEHSQTAHVKLKPYSCSLCHKRFTQQGGVLQHMRLHTGDRPFACTFCPKAFNQKSGLDQHLRIHTKVKPYRCVVCSKSFSQSVHLQQHMRTHTNVAPFQCGICQKRFKQSSHLNYHLKYHNPANMTEEQRQKYAQLVKLMGKAGEVVEIEIDQSKNFQTMEQQVSSEPDQCEILTPQQVINEQVQIESNQIKPLETSNSMVQTVLLPNGQVEEVTETYTVIESDSVQWCEASCI